MEKYFVEVVQVALELAEEFRFHENVLNGAAADVVIVEVEDELKSLADVPDVLLHINRLQQSSSEITADMRIYNYRSFDLKRAELVEAQQERAGSYFRFVFVDDRLLLQTLTLTLQASLERCEILVVGGCEE